MGNHTYLQGELSNKGNREKKHISRMEALTCVLKTGSGIIDALDLTFLRACESLLLSWLVWCFRRELGSV